MSISTLETILSRNQTYKRSHEPLPTFAEAADLGLPTPSTVIISCADPRVWPEKIFNLDPAEAIVFRNVSGHPQPAYRDILALDAFLQQQLTHIVIMHHTDCGATHFTNHLVQSTLSAQGHSASDVEQLVGASGGFGAIEAPMTIEESVKVDMEWLRSSEEAGMLRPELRKNGVRGFVFDIKTGGVTEVE